MIPFSDRAETTNDFRLVIQQLDRIELKLNVLLGGKLGPDSTEKFDGILGRSGLANGDPYQYIRGNDP